MLIFISAEIVEISGPFEKSKNEIMTKIKNRENFFITN